VELDFKIHGGLILSQEVETSELGRDLDALKDPETGHIMVTSSQATKLLLDCLVLEYRRTGRRISHTDAGFWSIPLVEALDTARKAQGQETVDLTQILEGFKEKREKRVGPFPRPEKEYGDLDLI